MREKSKTGGSIVRERKRGKQVLFIGWRLVAGGIRNDKRRRPAAFLFAFLLHIIGWLRRGVKIKGMFIAGPHHQIACRQQIFHGTAITAVRDTQGLLNINGAEGKRELILIAAKI